MIADPMWNLESAAPAGDGDRSRLREHLGLALGAGLEDRVRAEVCRGVRVDEVQRRRLAEGILRQAGDEYARRTALSGLPTPAPAEVEAALDEVLQDVYGLRRLQPLLDDRQVAAIHVDGADRVFARSMSGERGRCEPLVASDAELAELVKVLAVRSGVEHPELGPRSPLRFTLPDGVTVRAVVALGGTVSAAIRRPRRVVPTLGGLRHAGAFDSGLRGFLAAAVRARHTIVVTGCAGVGKTTLLAALADEIDPLDRLVSVEDTPQLRLSEDPDSHPDMVALSTPDRASSGWSEVSMGERGEVVEWASWLDPDWLIVDDLGGDEIGPWAEALISGVARSIAAMTAISPTSALDRLVNHLSQASTGTGSRGEAATLVASTVDFVVHLVQTPVGVPVVSAVREVIDADGTQVVTSEVYRPGPDRRAIPGTPLREDTLRGLVDCGFQPDTLGWPR